MKQWRMLWLVGILCWADNVHARQPNLSKPERPASTTASTINLTTPVKLNPAAKTSKLAGRNIATCNYGFFCKQELKADKKLPMPVRLRVGSMQSNGLAGKQTKLGESRVIKFRISNLGIPDCMRVKAGIRLPESRNSFRFHK